MRGRRSESDRCVNESGWWLQMRVVCGEEERVPSSRCTPPEQRIAIEKSFDQLPH